MAPVGSNTSVDQAFDVLHLVAAGSEPVGVADVARALGLATSTAHRVLMTLVDTGYLARDATGTKYELGIMAHELAESFLAGFGIRHAANAYIRRLVALSGETVTLSVRVGWYSVRVGGLEGWRDIHASPRVGAAAPLDATGAGSLLLSGLDDADLDRYVRWRHRTTAARKRARQELGKRAEELRRAGYALIHGDGGQTTQLSLGVRGPDGHVLAVLTIEGEASTFAPKPRSAAFKDWLGVVHDLEAAVAAEPALTADPYAHVAPNDVRMDEASSAAARAR